MGRGFAGMDPEKQKAIAASGGRAAHAKGTAYEWRKDDGSASRAGRAGGRASGVASAKRKATSGTE